MKDVLSHPLGPLLWALANGYGSVWKKNKAVLARELEKLASPAERSIIDGMSIKNLKGTTKCFLR